MTIINELARISCRISKQVGQDAAQGSFSNSRGHYLIDKARAFEHENGVADCPRDYERCGLDRELDDLTDEEKIEIISHHFGHILETLGMDLSEEHLRKTPERYAKMLVNELFCGMNENNFPSITLQDNEFDYREMLIEYNIAVKSICEHHFMPILGYCHIAYIPDQKIIGLSKLNRVAQHIAGRPQIQERMTRHIKESLIEVLETEDVGVVVDAQHLCVRMRGIRDSASYTREHAIIPENCDSPLIARSL